MSLSIVVRPGCKEVSQRKLEIYDKYCQIIQWGRQNPIQFASRFMGVETLDLQAFVIANTWPADFALWLESRNAGKALALDTKIPTPTGIRLMKDLCVGDEVYGPDGVPTKITYASPIFLGNRCFSIKFDDGETVVADADHLWQVKKHGVRDGADDNDLLTVSTLEMSRQYVRKQQNGEAKEYLYHVPNALPLQLPAASLPIDPYTLGVWLGSESSAKPQATDEKSSFADAVRDLDLVNNKRIPEHYLHASVEQRYELLRGLMDAGGTCDEYGHCAFAQRAPAFIAQFSELLDSLCIRYTVQKQKIPCDESFCDFFRVDFLSDRSCPCFNLERKKNQLPASPSAQSNFKSIVEIKEVESVPTKCLAVDHPRSLYLFGTHPTVTHNTTKLAIYTMLRSLLLPYHATYFLGNTGDQAKETFSKIEKLAKKEIQSFAGCTDVFFDEIMRAGPTGDGFNHNPASFTFKLFNGSTVNTLNSDVTNIKGKRANLVCFDEAGWFSDELFVQAEQFVNQDENFKLGGNINIALEPRGFPRQLLYASSASDTDSEFYKKFRFFSERMLMGDTKYFACNINIDTVMGAKFKGEAYPPLISKDKVDKAMSDNKEKALRELYNRFSADSHEGQILTRRDLMQCTVNRPPLLCNDTGDRLFAIAWDSARLNDNSVIGVAEMRMDPEKGWCMDVHNVTCLVDISSKKKTPLRLPDQVKRFQDILIAYNGSDHMKMDYENIKGIICDSGAGGQMIGGVSDYLLDEWMGSDGRKHKGLIDKSHKANETAKRAYPDAVDIMKLVDPRAHRNEIFDAAEKMVKLGVVTFPSDYDGKDEIVRIADDGTEEKYVLSADEKMSLVQIDLMKTEIITMCKYTNGGSVSYNFPPDKRNTMHDDRAFTLGLLCWYLALLRRGQVLSKPKKVEPDSLFAFRAPEIKRR